MEQVFKKFVLFIRWKYGTPSGSLKFKKVCHSEFTAQSIFRKELHILFLK